MPSLDLKKLDELVDSQGIALSLTLDPPEKRAAEALTKSEDAAHARWKDRWVFRVLLGGTVAGTALLAWVAFVKDPATPEQQKFARDGLLALAVGAVGYLVGDKKK